MSSERSEPQTERDWNAEVKGRLKAEMKLRNMSYADLVRALARLGITESEANLRNKVSRGGFSAVFFVQCLESMGAMAPVPQYIYSEPIVIPGLTSSVVRTRKS